MRDEHYGLGKDSKKQDRMPTGTLTEHHWVNKKFYPGTERHYWLCIPKDMTLQNLRV